jgi:hypothetical protein
VSRIVLAKMCSDKKLQKTPFLVNVFFSIHVDCYRTCGKNILF